MNAAKIIVTGCTICGGPTWDSNPCAPCAQSLDEQQTHYDRISSETVYDSGDPWVEWNEANAANEEDPYLWHYGDREDG